MQSKLKIKLYNTSILFYKNKTVVKKINKYLLLLCDINNVDLQIKLKNLKIFEINDWFVILS